MQDINRLGYLTGLRGLAALSVLLGHSIHFSFFYRGDGPTVTVLTDFGSELAYFGMSLFFVLSGFVIHYNYQRLFASERYALALYKFMVARLARLYPLFIFAVALGASGVALSKLLDHPGIVLSYITMTQSWINAQEFIFPPAWSISTEFFFYVVFACMAPVLLRLRMPFLVLLLFGALCPTLITWVSDNHQVRLFDIVAQYLVHETDISAGAGRWVWYYAPMVRVAEFLLGVLASASFLSVGKPTPLQQNIAKVFVVLAAAWCVGLIVVGGFVTPVPLGAVSYNFAYAPGIAIVMIGLGIADWTPRKAFETKPALYFGEISYSVYIFQFWIFASLAGTFLSSEPTPAAYLGSGLKVLCLIALTTFVATGSYWLLERPSRAMLRRWLLQPRPAQALAVAAAHPERSAAPVTW